MRLQETREATHIVDKLLDGLPSGPDHGQGPAHHQGARGRGVVTPRTRSARLATTSSAAASSCRSGSINSASFNNVSVVPWVLRGVFSSPMSSPSWRRSTSSSGHRPVMFGVDLPYWAQSLLRVLGARRGAVAGGHPRLRPLVQDDELHQTAGPDGSWAVRFDAAVRRVGKWLQRRTSPRYGRVRIFKLAPLIVLVSTFLLVAVVPFGPDAYFTDFEAGIFYALAVSSVSVLGILIAGWSSANKYSLLGGLRAAGQLIAYELPMVLAVLAWSSRRHETCKALCGQNDDSSSVGRDRQQ